MLRWLRTVLQIVLTAGVTLLLASVFNPNLFQPKVRSQSLDGSLHFGQRIDFSAQSRTFGKDEARAVQGYAAAPVPAGSNLKPVLRIAYCSFPQDLKLEYTTAEIELVARGLAEPLQDRYVVHLESCAANQQHIDRYKKENGLSMTREEELEALGLNADIRICFFSTTEIVAILKEERNGHIVRMEIPESFQHTFTADYMLYWPQDIRHIVDDNGDPVGPVLVRRSSESWGQYSEGVAIQLESKRHRGSLQEHGVTMYLPFVVTSLLARAKPDDPTPSGFIHYHGCCFQDKNSILQDATRRVGYFNPTQERVRKTGFASFLQSHCHSHLLSTSLRHAFVFALSEYKNVSLLGACPRGTSATQRLGYESETERSAFRQQFRPYDSVTVHSHFKFSLVMENSIVPGYVTEKFLEAYLARSIPIYMGSDPFSMQQTFNPRAFIYCDVSRDSFSEKILSRLQASMCDGNHESTPEGRECNYQFDLAVLELTRPSFAKCLAEVIRLDNDDKAYEEMLSEPLLPNHGQLSGPWNFTHHANVLDLVYRVLRKGSQQYHWDASSWSPPHNIKGVPKFVYTKH